MRVAREERLPEQELELDLGATGHWLGGFGLWAPGRRYDPRRNAGAPGAARALSRLHCVLPAMGLRLPAPRRPKRYLYNVQQVMCTTPY